MTLPDYQAARHYALSRLEAELPAFLSYHSVRHTRDGVVPAVERIAAREGEDGDALLLLCTAAWFHDIGFVAHQVDHEAIGIRIAGTILPRFGYSPSQIAAIGGMIMATKLPQSPQTRLEQILADADMDGLGRPDFLERNAELRAELAAQGTALTDSEWYSDQIAFLRGHRYWTASARALRDAQKQRNLDAMARLLSRDAAHSS